MKSIEIVRRILRRPYPVPMGIARRPPKDHLEPEHRPADLAHYENKWIGMLGGDVVAVADTSSGLAIELRKLGPEGREAVMQFVRPPMAGYVIGVG